MEVSQDPIKTQILYLYLQLSEVTAKMVNQIKGGVGGDYRLTYFDFRELMYQLHDLSQWHLKEPDKNYVKWAELNRRMDASFVLMSAKMYEGYIKKLVENRIIDVRRDV